jgi:hypothetical protein
MNTELGRTPRKATAMSSIPDAHGVRQHADDLAPDSSPAVPFTEAQARAWVAANGTKSVRLLAKLWGWSVGKVQRFLNRVQTDSPESPTESEPPEPPELDPNEFDLKRSECVLPARTFVSAYIDDNGDLRICASDARYQCDTELRINAEDIEQFLFTLNGIWQEAQERGQP